jgi:hypothetical protein
MIHARDDYNRIQDIPQQQDGGIAMDEPVMLFRANGLRAILASGPPSDPGGDSGPRCFRECLILDRDSDTLRAKSLKISLTPCTF